MASHPWSENDKRRYRLASFAIALMGYGAVAVVAFASSASGDMMRLTVMAALGVVVVICLGHAVLGRLTRAPGVFNGATITLIAAGIPATGAMALLTVIEPALPSELPPLAMMALRAVGALGCVISGAAITSYWSSDAASSDAVGDD